MTSIDALARSRVPHVEEYYDLLRYETDPVAGYRLSPNQALPHATINRDGYRGRLLSGEESLLLLGDSVTFGVGASSDQACFSRFLEEATGVSVADTSVRAYRVFQHYARLPVLLARLPKLQRVILWFGYADLLWWVLSGGSVEGAFNFANKYGNSSQPAGWRQRLRRLVRKDRTGSVKTDPPPAQDLDELALHVGIHCVAIRDLLNARGIKLSLLLQPFVRSRPGSADLACLTDSYDEKSRRKTGQGWYEVSSRWTELLREHLTREEFCWKDCQSWVEEEDFLDQVHLKEAAAGRLAQRVAREGGLWR